MIHQTSDNQSQLIDERKIPAEIRRRLNDDELISIPPKLQGDYEANGWVHHSTLKTRVKMRRTKTHDVAFEDRVWAAMAKLGFKRLNMDRHFKLPYGPNTGETQQVDVFAADDEVVLIIECKSTTASRTETFKKETETIRGQRTGTIRALREIYADHKICFILATSNFGTSTATEQRFTDASIVHMDEEAITYFLGLADHLGLAARYQLHGYLFSGQKIPGIEPQVAAIQGKMGGHTYYSFAIEPARLLKLSYILHRNKANNAMMPTYQRLIKKSRLNAIGQFVDGGGFFPNSIIVNIDTPRKRLRFDRVSKQTGDAKLGILHLPQTFRASYIIDGQHRLFGYANSDRSETDMIPVVAFENLPRADQVRLFMQINENQKAVPKNLRNTLNADLLWESDDLREQARALSLRVAQRLGEDRSSPLFGRVVVGEDARSITRCITIEAINRGVYRGNFNGEFSKNELKMAGTFYRGTNDATFSALAPFLDLCFERLRDDLPRQWNLGNADGGIVFINTGIEAILRILSDMVDHVVEADGLAPSSLPIGMMFGAIEPLLQHLIDYLDSLALEDVNALRKRYGSGGPTRFWRDLQVQLNSADVSFQPAGLKGYLKDQEKQLSSRSYDLINELEFTLRAEIRRSLENEFGSQWEKEGIPLKVRQESAMQALSKNEELEASNEVEAWDCIYIIDLQKVLQNSHETWNKLFETRYTRPGEEQMSWKKRTDWIGRLNGIRNDVMHSRPVSEDDFQFLVSLKTWLVDGASNIAL